MADYSKLVKLAQMLGKTTPKAAEETAAKMFKVGDVTFPAANTAEAIKVKRALEEAGRIAPNKAIQALSSNKNLAAAGAIGAATLGGQEEAEAGVLADTLKIAAKMPNKEEAASLLRKVYESSDVPGFPRQEYADFIVDQLKQTYPEFSKASLDNLDSLQDVNALVEKQLGIKNPTTFLKQQDAYQDPKLAEDLIQSLRKNNPNVSDARILAKAKEQQKFLADMTGGTNMPSLNKSYIFLRPNQNIDTKLGDIVHEAVHQLDTTSGKTFKDTLFNAEKSPELSSRALDTLAFRAKNSPLVADSQHIPENRYNTSFSGRDPVGRALQRYGIEDHVLASLDPKQYNELLEVMTKRDPVEKDFVISKMFPEYAKGIRGSVGHSSNLYTGIEHGLAKDAALKGIDPLSSERAASILKPIDLKKAAGIAGVAMTDKASATEPGKISPPTNDLLPLSASASQYQAPAKFASGEDINPLSVTRRGFKEYEKNIKEPYLNPIADMAYEGSPQGAVLKALSERMGPESFAAKLDTIGKGGYRMALDPVNLAPGSVGALLGGAQALSELTDEEDKDKNNK